jgi:RND family efflux transporter MFP subunit
VNRVDLSALRMESAPAAPLRKPWQPRLLTAGAGLLVFAVAASFAWPLLRPARLVPTTAVRAAPEKTSTSATAVAEAVGWIEADPFPVIVRPLVSGRIETIHVLEGAEVQAGVTVLATLASASLQAARERAVALAGERDAAYQAAVTAHEQASAHTRQNAEARRALAESRMREAEAAGKLASARGQRERMAAEARGAAAALAAQEQLAQNGTSNQVALERARAAVAAADAAAAAAVAEATSAESAHAAAVANRELNEQLAAHPVELEHAERVAHAAVAQAKAAQDTAHAELTIAEREWQWREVRAPVDGVVLRLLAAPGASVGPGGEGILSLYDRHHLRARIDVPLGSVGGITEGQEVELKSEVTGLTVVHGAVQRLQQESDLLKNTLQVKVQLIDPPALWRPETLCRARFLGGVILRDGINFTFVVPKVGVRGDAVFVFDPAARRARRVPVTIVGEEGDQVVVRGGLSPAQRVILAEVQDGDLVREEVR